MIGDIAYNNFYFYFLLDLMIQNLKNLKKGFKKSGKGRQPGTSK
jgi:hypothetical protein